MDRCHSYGLWLLSRRNYSILKLRRKLQSKKFAPAEIDQCIHQLVEQGFLRERMYVEEKVRLWSTRGYSPSLIQRRLRVDGIHLTPSEWSEVTQTVGLEDPKSSQVLETLIQTEIRKLRHPFSTDREAQTKVENKILRAVFRKGYSPSLARPLIRQHLKGALSPH